MICQEIITQIEEHWPKNMACEWDNVGLLVGDSSRNVKRIMLALDATDDVIAQAVEQQADMLITHHPMIFRGIKQITEADFIGRRVRRLIQSDIAYYAMHTNFDVNGMADAAADKLGLQKCEVLEATSIILGQQLGIGVVGYSKKPMTLEECANQIKQSFDLQAVRVFGALDTKVERIAVSPGSGRSEIAHALGHHADVLITGDIDHHDGMDAVMQGLTIIDAGHYGLEHIFAGYMKRFINEAMPELTVLAANEEAPFRFV